MAKNSFLAEVTSNKKSKIEKILTKASTGKLTEFDFTFLFTVYQFGLLKGYL